MNKARRMLLTACLAFAASLPSWAVFNEKDLAQTLHVLRYELSKAYLEMSRNLAVYEKQDEQQHRELVSLIQGCNELSLMLYSQKQDFTFDLTYALQQVTDQYHRFTKGRMPYDNIISYFDVEIDRYRRLITALEFLHPGPPEAADSLGAQLPDSLAIQQHLEELQGRTYSRNHVYGLDFAGHRRDSTGDGRYDTTPLLDSLSLADRDSCIFFASNLLRMYSDIRERMVKDNEHYETTDARLREAYDYAQGRYKLVQKKIFVEGQVNYWYILTHLRPFAGKAFADFKDKYGRDYFSDRVNSEWRGPMVVGFSFIILIYLALATLISWLLIKALKKKVRLFQTPSFEKREFTIILLASVIFFVLLIVLARLVPAIGTNFFMMASSLLVEFALLLIAILTSMLIRCTGAQVRSALRIYTPVMLMGLLVITFRIMFIPNSLITLLHPPLLLAFWIWQEAAYRNNSEKVPQFDRSFAIASLVVIALTFVLSIFGYALVGLQVYIWWIFQLTVLQLIIAIDDLIKKYRRRRVDKLVRAYRIKHLSTVGTAKGAYVPVTWLYDFFDRVLIPLLVLLSIPSCFFMASRVFDLTEICKEALYYPFLDTSAIQLSLFKVILAVGLFFVFRYIEYVSRSLYRIYKVNSMAIKTGNGILRENDVNLTLANNVTWLLVWGLYVIVTIGLLSIPTKSLSFITAGLAAGLGFAMKDILNNFFYGVQLMSGRLRVGDTLECDGIRGTVENISYQTTTIKAIDGSLIVFPNSVLFSKTFKNLTKNDSYEYVTIPVGVAYGTDVEKARKAIMAALAPLRGQDEFGRDVVKPSYGIQITLSGFGDSSLGLMVKQHVLVEQRFGYVAKANEAIYKALNANGIEIPFPQRDVYIRQAPPPGGKKA